MFVMMMSYVYDTHVIRSGGRINRKNAGKKLISELTA